MNVLIHYLMEWAHMNAIGATIGTLTIKTLNIRRKQKEKKYFNIPLLLCTKFQEEEARRLCDRISQGLIGKAAVEKVLSALCFPDKVKRSIVFQHCSY